MSDAIHGTAKGAGSTPKLALGALGIVFGDIGTSPLYALKESFVGHHPLPVDRLHIFGVLSLIFWTMMLIVTVKYVFIIMRADNDGEGGSLALLALILRKLGNGPMAGGIAMLGILATALFYGDTIITPAMSVLSAVEGIAVVNGSLEPLIVPLSVVILIGVFAMQTIGTAKVARLFGPVMVLYFASIAIIGILALVRHPDVLAILDPRWAIRFFAADFRLAFLSLGSVVLAVTGAEALYADMGHFGRRPISIAWLYVALPCLMLNYLGQGATLLDQPAAASNPFYLTAPEAVRIPLLVIATLAAIIASQAVISGAFSVTQQAIQLGLMPRMQLRYTSEHSVGQVYVPAINTVLMVLVIGVVLGFRSSGALAAAYGIAVTGTMLISTLMLGALVFTVWRWPIIPAVGVVGSFVIIDGFYFASNATKIPDGGWFPLLVAAIIFLLVTTWAKGRQIVNERLAESNMPLELFVRSAEDSLQRVSGTAVFLTAGQQATPSALLHNVKHNHVLHDRNVVATMIVERIPYVAIEERTHVQRIAECFWRVEVRYGFMDEVDLPAALEAALPVDIDGKRSAVSYFLGRQTLIASPRPGMAIWREKLFAAMSRNAESAMTFFKLPTNRVVELGSQVEL